MSGAAGLNVGLFKIEGKVGVPGQYVIPDRLTSVNHAANLIKEAALSRMPSPIVCAKAGHKILQIRIQVRLGLVEDHLWCRVRTVATIRTRRNLLIL